VQTPQAAAAAGPYGPNCWRADRLPMLGTIGPLLPGAPDKRPLVGNDWEAHAGVGISELQAAAPECICWHVGAAPGYIAIDIDGPRAAAFCQQHSCEPYTADTWRIVRTGNTDRLKLVYTVTTEQKAALVSGAKTVKVGAGDGGLDDKGEELAVFAKPGTQIVVLGNHYTKESGFTENDDQYAWAGRAPADAQPLPPEWFALLTGVFCGERPLRPKTRRSVSDSSTRGARSYSGASGTWRNSSQRQPCPMCGRDHSGACSIHQDNDSVWCCHGETKSAPDCSNKGEIVTGRDARTWAYVRTEDHDSFGERSLFVLHKPKPKPDPPTPPLNGEPFIPSDEPADQAAGEPWRSEPVDDEDAAAALVDLISELRSFRDASELAAAVTPQLLLPPDVATKLIGYATEQQLPVRGFYLPIFTTVASIIGNRAHCVPQSGDEVKGISVLWGMSIGGVSAGKSPITAPTIERPLVGWHSAEREKHQAAIQEWNRAKAKAEELEKRRRNGDEAGGSDDPVGDFLAENPQPERRYIISTDTTIEKLEINLLSTETPGHISFHDELSGWFTNLCRERGGKSDRPKWLAIGSGSALLTDRVNRTEVIIPNPRCSLFGNLQPARISGLWEADVKACHGVPDADGLWARFHMIQLPEWDYRYQKTSVHLAPVLSNLYKAIDATAAALPLPGPGKSCEIMLAEDAIPLWAQWVDALLEMRRARTLQEDKGYIIKLRGTTLTLALIFHAIKCGASGMRMDVPIKNETLMSAISFAGLLIVERDRVLCAVRDADATGKVKELLARGQEWRRANGSAPVPLDQLRAWCLPQKRMKAAERRAWLERVVLDAPAMGELKTVHRSLQWLPPA
jgi:hypothetical protein